MILSKNKIKYLSSLKLKKFRDQNGKFLAEGDKIVKDTLIKQTVEISLLAATKDWLKTNTKLTENVKEVYLAELDDLSKITSFESPPPVIALIEMPEVIPDFTDIGNSLSIALDNIQDPGNLGTIIRTADWFGIRNIFCSSTCADIYNPKVIQSSMGALFNIKVHYYDLKQLFTRLSSVTDYIIAGTFLNGNPVISLKGTKKGIIIFGNESRGISGEFADLISEKLTIPAANPGRDHVESLNVASSVAAVLALITLSE
jgi:TrmH family RNA methyltransferase